MESFYAQQNKYFSFLNVSNNLVAIFSYSTKTFLYKHFKTFYHVQDFIMYLSSLQLDDRKIFLQQVIGPNLGAYFLSLTKLFSVLFLFVLNFVVIIHSLF